MATEVPNWRVEPVDVVRQGGDPVDRVESDVADCRVW